MADHSQEETEHDEASSRDARIPPYVSFATFLTFLKDLKTNGLPPQIDKSVMSKMSGGAQSQMKMALRSLGLIEGDKPTPRLAVLIDGFDTPRFEPVMAAILRETYPYVFALDLMSATPTMFADAFKVTGGKEDVLRKCRTFFLHAAKRVGVPLGQRILTGSVPRAPSNGARRKPKSSKGESDGAEGGAAADPASVKNADGPKNLGKDHPLVTGLLMTLPAPGKRWDTDSRVSWLRMAAFIFENIYEGKGGISIEADRPKQTAADQ